MGLPPLDGAVQLTVAVPLPAVAVTLVGAAAGVGLAALSATSSRYMEVSSGGLEPS